MESDYRKQVNYIYKEVDSIFKKEKKLGTLAKKSIIQFNILIITLLKLT